MRHQEAEEMKRVALTLAGLFTLAVAGCSSDNNNGGTGGTGGGAGTGGRGGTGGGTAGTGGGTAGTGGAGGTGGKAPDAGGKMDRGPDTMRAPDAGTSQDANQDANREAGGGGTASPMMSFFVTSGPAGNGGDLGGLAGADRKCQEFAAAVGVGNKTWKAYLSTATENARDRIGTGPWRNVRGTVVAENVTQLHDQGMNMMGGALAQTWPRGQQSLNLILDEKGAQVPTGGAAGQRHDILTGSNLAGMVDGNNTCNNWTATTGTSRVGHMNRAGGGQNPDSWNSAHTAGCAPNMGNGNFQAGTVGSGGGRGSIYCFATN
jgi:hypothetical protein